MAAADNRTTGTVTDVGATFGTNVITYSPPPADVINLTQAPAPAFSSFPLTVTP